MRGNYNRTSESPNCKERATEDASVCCAHSRLSRVSIVSFLAVDITSLPSAIYSPVLHLRARHRHSPPPSQTSITRPPTMATEPITPARFAAALQDLPLSSLALKVAELRNSIAHLDYSNEQLKPFAHPATPGEEGDPDCAEAIVENEDVIARMNERIALVKDEVERRGASWREVGFMLSAPGQTEGKINGTGAGGEHVAMANGVAGEEAQGGGTAVDGHGSARGPEVDEAAGVGRHSAWTDGTFQTGTISGGAMTMDQNAGLAQRRQGGTLGDEELRRRLEERMRGDGHDEDGGMHL